MMQTKEERQEELLRLDADERIFGKCYWIEDDEGNIERIDPMEIASLGPCIKYLTKE